MTTLLTERLALMPCRPDDAADFMALERDPEVMRFLNGGPVDHATLKPEDAPFLMPRGTEPYVWTARRRIGGCFVGWFCLAPDSDTQAELGYRLKRTEWGQGLATEGAAALLRWGFDQGGYDRITASTMAVNLGSRRVMAKIGMRHHFTDFTPYPDPLPGSEQGEVWYEALRANADAHPVRPIS